MKILVDAFLGGEVSRQVVIVRLGERRNHECPREVVRVVNPVRRREAQSTIENVHGALCELAPVIPFAKGVNIVCVRCT
jgi:hypothetical protein